MSATVGACVALVVILGLYLGFELGMVYLVKRAFRWLGDALDRRDRAALGLSDKPDAPRRKANR